MRGWCWASIRLVDWKPGSGAGVRGRAMRRSDEELFTQLVPDGALGRLGAFGIQPP